MCVGIQSVYLHSGWADIFFTILLNYYERNIVGPTRVLMFVLRWRCVCIECLVYILLLKSC